MDRQETALMSTSVSLNGIDRANQHKIWAIESNCAPIDFVFDFDRSFAAPLWLDESLPRAVQDISICRTFWGLQLKILLAHFRRWLIDIFLIALSLDWNCATTLFDQFIAFWLKLAHARSLHSWEINNSAAKMNAHVGFWLDSRWFAIRTQFDCNVFLQIFFFIVDFRANITHVCWLFAVCYARGIPMDIKVLCFSFSCSRAACLTSLNIALIRWILLESIHSIISCWMMNVF